MSLDKIDKIRKISKSLEQIQRPEGINVPNREQFDAAMRKDAVRVDTSKEIAEVSKPTLMDEVRNSSNSTRISRGSHREILAQLDDTLNKIDNVKVKLNTPDLDLKNSTQSIMRKKLLHIDESLKSALARVGNHEGLAATEALTDKAMTPIQKFLGLLTEGQARLNTLSSSIEEIAKSHDLNPAALLALQVKVSTVQQQVELFTSLLNKALESTKTIMNVQV